MIFIFNRYQRISLFFGGFFLCHPAFKSGESSVPIEVWVENTLNNTPPLFFRADIVYRGILLGALNKLMASNSDFK